MFVCVILSLNLFKFISEEEKWHAQYGQVTRLADDGLSAFSVVDLWDWEMIVENVKNNHVARLIGSVTRRSSKLHPSIPGNGSLLKTAAIRNVRLDLVRVASGMFFFSSDCTYID